MYNEDMNEATPTAYEQRQEDRRNRLESAATRASAESTASLNLARQRASVIPFGQPMMPGHHSYKGDRSFRDKIHNGYAKGFALQGKAEHYATAAAAVGAAGSASDNPDAPTLLATEIARLEVELAALRAARKISLKIVKAHGISQWANDEGGNEHVRAELAEALTAASLPDWVIREATVPSYPGQAIGIPAYMVSNRAANLNTKKKRVEALSTHDLDDGPSINGDGWQVRTEDGRITLAFDERLDRADWLAVKSAGGFNWSRTREAFIRVDTPNARHTIAYQAERNWGLTK
jgi:hypothetical protein